MLLNILLEKWMFKKSQTKQNKLIHIETYIKYKIKWKLNNLGFLC